MSWSVPIPASPVADFPATADKALAEAHVERQNAEGVKAAEYAVKIAKEIVASGVLRIGEGKHVSGSLSGHASTDGLDTMNIGLYGTWPPAPTPSPTS